MISNNDILKWYMKGWEDELDGKRKNKSLNPLLNTAYSVGQSDAIIGDEISSNDLKSNEEIINEIREINI